MGLRFYRRISLGKGLSLNISKSGLGLSAGPRGLRFSVHSSGLKTTSMGIPGTGLSYRTQKGGGGHAGSRARLAQPSAPIPYRTGKRIRPGMFAPRYEKLFYQGLMLVNSEDRAAALEKFEAARAAAGDKAESSTYFAGFCAGTIAGREKLALRYLEEVLASDTPLPDPLMTKYVVGGHATFPVTPGLEVEVPFNTVGAALMAAELYQEAGEVEKAIGALEAIIAHGGRDLVVVTSLAELYSIAGHFDDVIEITDGVSNTDDVSCQALIFRARAMSAKGLHDAALETLKDALRSSKRLPNLLLAARYERGLIHEEMGQRALARKDFEKVFAQDSGYADVAEKLDPSKRIDEQSSGVE